MIIVKIWGGIGNQLFQYVFGQYLRFRYDQEVWYDDNSYQTTDKLRKRELDALDADIHYDNSCKFSKYRGVKNRLLRYTFQLLPKNHYICEGDKLPETFKKEHVYFFQGYWQAIEYYNWLKNHISGFEIKSKVIPTELLPLFNEIKAENNSLSVHVRRGDYFIPKNIKTYGVCDAAYFKKSLAELKSTHQNLKTYIFTDDLDWVKSNLHLDESVTLIPNYPISQFVYIELMSLCKHHIISNSSFSWWGAVLNEQPNAIVVAPSKWTLTSEKTIALNKWKKI